MIKSFKNHLREVGSQLKEIERLLKHTFVVTDLEELRLVRVNKQAFEKIQKLKGCFLDGKDITSRTYEYLLDNIDDGFFRVDYVLNAVRVVVKRPELTLTPDGIKVFSKISPDIREYHKIVGPHSVEMSECINHDFYH